MLAHEAIEPALDAAGQREIVSIDGENERVIEDADVEPVGQDHLDAERAAVGVGRLLPFVDPGKAMATTFGRLPDRGRDCGGLEPVEPGFEPLIVAGAGAAADEGQDLVGRRRHQAGGLEAGVSRVDDLGRRPDQHVGVPDGRHAMLGDGLDADRDRARPEIDRG